MNKKQTYFDKKWKIKQVFAMKNNKDWIVRLTIQQK
jgi:hypothetical protein